MGYVIVAVLVLLIVGGFVTFMVLNATEKSGPAAAGDEGAPGIGGDETPLGDTTEHAGRQTEHGTTAGGQDGVSGDRGSDPDAAAHVARPGEGEGAEGLEFEGERPDAGAPRTPDAAEPQPEAEPRTEDRPRSSDEPEPEPPASERLADRGV